MTAAIKLFSGDSIVDQHAHNLFKEMVTRGKNIRLSFAARRLLARDDHSSILFTMSLALAVAVRKIFREKAQIDFTHEPVIEKKPITHFMKRMRVDPMEKFNAPTVVSYIHFYRNLKEMELQKPTGVILSYIQRSYLTHLLKLLDYPEIDDDDEEQVEDACGAVCNIIGGYFKNELISLGFPAMEMSIFESYINSVVNGVNYPAKAEFQYEISYNVGGVKRLVTEMVMLPLQRSSIF